MDDVSQIEINQITRNDTSEWDAYVNNHPHGTIFHLTAWKRVVEKTFGHKSHYFMAGNDKGIQGVFPVFEIKSLLFGHSFISVPFAETGGILADHQDTAFSLLDRVAGLCLQQNAACVELRNTQALPDLETKDLYSNFSKEIFPDYEQNLLAIPRKSRAMVRKALKNGLTSETGHHLVSEFYDLLSLNFHRLGTPIFHRSLFNNLLDEFGTDSDILIVRNTQGIPIAGVLYFVFKDRMMPYYAGSDFSYRQLGPNDFMYWELMRLAVDRGLCIFDFGRSKIGTGSYNFKKHWGFEPKPLAYQYILSQGHDMPNLSPANPKYQRKIELWRKMPLALTRFIGPYLSKYLA